MNDRRGLVAVVCFVATLTGCSQGFTQRVYQDSNAGQRHEGAFYVDPTGWSINNVVTVYQLGKGYYEIKEAKEDSPILAGEWSRRIDGLGMYKVMLHCDKNGPDTFRVLTIESNGLKLMWSKASKVYAFSVSEGDTVSYESQDIIFSKDTQRVMYRTADMADYDYLVVSNDDPTWDRSRSGIIAVVQFARDPAHIEYFQVTNVASQK